MIKSLGNTRIKVTRKTSVEVQRVAFDLGFRWVNTDDEKIQNEGSQYLYFYKRANPEGRNVIRHGTSRSQFDLCEFPEITVDDVREMGAAHQEREVKRLIAKGSRGILNKFLSQ